jgi:hypothetical protein
MFESVLGTIFAVCTWSWVRTIADHIPDAIMGRLFVLLRTRWKAATKTVKRGGIGTTVLREV